MGEILIPYREPVPQSIGEMMDLLGSMMISSPTFSDSYFPGRNAETVFGALHEGLDKLRTKLGADRFNRLNHLALEIRALFEADPNGGVPETMRGREKILEMERVLRER